MQTTHSRARTHTGRQAHKRRRTFGDMPLTCSCAWQSYRQICPRAGPTSPLWCGLVVCDWVEQSKGHFAFSAFPYARRSISLFSPPVYFSQFFCGGISTWHLFALFHAVALTWRASTDGGNGPPERPGFQSNAQTRTIDAFTTCTQEGLLSDPLLSRLVALTASQGVRWCHVSVVPSP